MESTAFEVRAIVKYVPMSPRKVRLVINQVRGLVVDEALAILKFTPKAAAKPVSKVIESAIANAEENYGLSREDLYVSQIFADVGPTQKRWKAGARGRVKPRLKRSSHITVVLGEMEVGS
ncbi:MAG: 50S ribosomal protein L22 [Anaerolineales bacterium]|nr:50S ribosomal protein L22 [Anaerolineales bacterium]